MRATNRQSLLGPPQQQQQAKPSAHRHHRKSGTGAGSSKTIVSRLSGNRAVVLLAAFFCLASFSLFPILVLENLSQHPSASVVGHHNNGPGSRNTVSVHNAVSAASRAAAVSAGRSKTKQQQQPAAPAKQKPAAAAAAHDDAALQAAAEAGGAPDASKRTTKDGRVLANLEVADLDCTLDAHELDRPVARGTAWSSPRLAETPAVQGAARAHVDCDVNVDSLAYWNDPIGARDQAFQSPFAAATTTSRGGSSRDTKYLSFAPDRGGWNNVRMSMEIIFVIAAATGRTLVLPPKEPLYLLHHDAGQRHRGFADFFPLETSAFQTRVKVISFADFLAREAQEGMPLAPKTAQQLADVTQSADHCEKREKAQNRCSPVFDYLKDVGYTPEISALHTCLVFDQDVYEGRNATSDTQEYLSTVCGPKRDQVFWDAALNAHKLVHFRASDKEYRLLSHFYGMIHFTNPAIDHYYKRFVRDFLHYHDQIYCAAGKIVKAVQWEGVQRGFAVDPEGAGAYSALHVRRGDLQYKKVKIPAQEWYDNTKEVWEPNEILYVATDERNKTFFDDLKAHHDLRFLDDYWDLAGLGDVDPNYMGMIDTIVASRGRAFAGTWFSTFSGYINRLRGYQGMSMKDSWYSFLPKKTAVHEWKVVDDFAYAFEWPDGWVGIDKDEFPKRDKF